LRIGTWSKSGGNLKVLTLFFGEGVTHTGEEESSSWQSCELRAECCDLCGVSNLK